ncbi:transcriptional factor [Desulfurispirillum indicum S5]|uniref:Transcriptional factor n=1 Tax=Desulfurispirillum indicum (strain ATCC BAA-1389 / DSM 22839 / S5) TaxID=653733 RepID=E6W033_DESIS|nr:WYL domain-containing protein [Desulfurispirillum indicum]ADU65159.1 transcriptional factor [Desulfurispirillum indicum S5]
MDKKFDTLLRQWKMLQMLRRRPVLSTREIQQKLRDDGFEVTLRTIQRDLQKLSAVFPIACDEKKPIGWKWAKGGESFSIPGMDTTTALTLRMVDEYLGKLLPKSCMASLSPHMLRAKAILSEQASNTLGHWPEKIRVIPRSMPLIAPQVEPEVLETLYDALLASRRCKARYRRRGEEQASEYLVNPLGLVVNDQIFYLVCTLREYDHVVLLALHRFESAQMVDTPSRKPAGFDLDEYLASGALGFANTPSKTISLQLRISRELAEHLQECPLSTNQTLSGQADADDQFLLKARVLDTRQLRWWLLGFADQVEVLAPKSLRQEFAEKSARMAERYE